MKLIAIEEHASNRALSKAARSAMAEESPLYSSALSPDLPYFPAKGSMRIDEARLQSMDAAGIDYQMVMTGVSMWMPACEAVGLCADANKELVKQLAIAPDRFGAFAAIPTCDPRAAAEELRRAKQLGFKGVAVIGRPDEGFLDDERHLEWLQVASELNMPIYLHPGLPKRCVQEAYYSGFSSVVSGRLLSFGWGWHSEAGIQLVRMILAGVFEKCENLTCVLGHWGEMVPYFLCRLDEALPMKATGLSTEISACFKQHVYVTPSGMFSEPHLKFCVDTLGAERIMFSVDYPFVQNEGAREFIESVDICERSRNLIAHGNAENLFDIAG